MIEYTVHFQRGSRVGARSLHMEYATAASPQEAIVAAQRAFPIPGYRVVRVDHFDDDNRLVIDQ